jgi:hypothetical protein
MDIDIVWEKLLFSGHYQFAAKDKVVGKLQFKRWKRESEGELMGITVRFQADGLFRKKTYMYLGEESKPFGAIYYNKGLFTNSATIKYNDNTYDWTFKNPFSTKWVVKDATSVRIRSKTNTLKGKLKITEPEAPLILASLLVSRYFKDSNTSILTVLFAGSAVFRFLLEMFG